MRRFVRGEVSSVDKIGARMRRIRITGPDLRGLPWLPGQHVQMLVGLGRQLGSRLPGPMRTYSVADLVDDTIELVMLDRDGDAPGETWARTAQVGRPAQFLTPHGDFVLRGGAAHHVFAGDETAMPAFAPMIRALPEQTPWFAALEVDSPADRLQLPDDVRWTYRSGAPAASSAALADAVAALPLPTEPGVAYVAGEARTVQLVRTALVARGWSRRDVLTKPFWTPGKKGLD